MKKFTYFLAVLFALALSTVSTGVMAKNGNNKADKVGVCHATSSESNPYLFIEVSSRALVTHLNHDGDFEGTSLADCLDAPPQWPDPAGLSFLECFDQITLYNAPFTWYGDLLSGECDYHRSE